MIPQLPAIRSPAWLASITAENIGRLAFPLHEILDNSLYYPSSGFDGRPVEWLGGNIVSFIYVDYGKTREDLEDQLKSERYAFNGYEIVATREVTERELTPRGWTPLLPRPGDGDPRRYQQQIQSPYCRWLVFQRNADLSDDHGAARFSLLYLCADGVAAFQALYHSNHDVPLATTIIRPGTGFGLNWTDYRVPDLIFHRSVLGNPAGKPELLLCDAGESPYWQEYDSEITHFGNGIRLWRRAL